MEVHGTDSLVERLPLTASMSIRALDSGQLEADLEEINFRNSVWFNRVKLLQIHGGENAMDLFTICRRRTLTKNGVLDGDHRRGGQRRTLTGRAIAVLLDGEAQGWPTGLEDSIDP